MNQVLFLFQDFQKEIVKAAETFTAIGYKHIETGETLSRLLLIEREKTLKENEADYLLHIMFVVIGEFYGIRSTLDSSHT